MIIDASLGFDEVELFTFRYEYLKPLVDVFVIGESNRTFAGQPKPLVFHDLKQRGLLADNVIVMNVEVSESLYGTVPIEQLQAEVRNQYAREVHSAYPSATIFFSDMDEIPSLEQV